MFHELECIYSGREKPNIAIFLSNNILKSVLVFLYFLSPQSEIDSIIRKAIDPLLNLTFNYIYPTYEIDIKMAVLLEQAFIT